MPGGEGNSGGVFNSHGRKVPQTLPIDAAIARIAGGQECLISLAQLYAAGLTDREVRGRVRRGLLHPRHRGVFIVGPPSLSQKGHLKAALLALDETAFLSHHTSIAWQGLRALDTRMIEVTVVATSTPRRPGLTVHRTSEPPHPSELRNRFGLRYSSFARAVVEIATDEPEDELMRLITAAVRKRIADVKAIERVLVRYEQRPGTAKVRRLFTRYLDPHDRKSGLERSFDDYVMSDPRIPAYERNVHLGPYEIDCLFRQQRLVVELDGRPWHIALQDTDRDHAKDIWLQRQGLRVMRITDFAWTYEKAESIENLLALLALEDAGSGDQAAA